MLFTKAAKTVIVYLNTINSYYIDNHLAYYIQLTISLSHYPFQDFHYVSPSTNGNMASSPSETSPPALHH
jgi:hypothetical protein